MDPTMLSKQTEKIVEEYLKITGKPATTLGMKGYLAAREQAIRENEKGYIHSEDEQKDLKGTQTMPAQNEHGHESKTLKDNISAMPASRTKNEERKRVNEPRVSEDAVSILNALPD